MQTIESETNLTRIDKQELRTLIFSKISLASRGESCYKDTARWLMSPDAGKVLERILSKQNIDDLRELVEHYRTKAKEAYQELERVEALYRIAVKTLPAKKMGKDKKGDKINQELTLIPDSPQLPNQTAVNAALQFMRNNNSQATSTQIKFHLKAMGFNATDNLVWLTMKRLIKKGLAKKEVIGTKEIRGSYKLTEEGKK